MNNISSYQKDVMCDAYWKVWSSSEQARIDSDIESHRKADCTAALGVPAGTEVRAEQITHDFIFGAHIFNFDQLGTDERNEKYKALYGTLFNSATIAFYWQPFEPVEGKMRFEPEFRDSAEYWNACADPKNEPHWRRPATDPVVAFCESRKIRLHGHPLVWANSTWHYPRWILDKLPKDILIQLLSDTRCGSNILTKTPEEIDRLIPGFSDALCDAVNRRIRAIAERYGSRIHSWDVCNESACDYISGRLIPGSKLCRSLHGTFMPGDYTYRAFETAGKSLPASAKLNINDYDLVSGYADQTVDLMKRGCKIDIMGAQMHLFDPQSCIDIAEGRGYEYLYPANVRHTMETIGRAGLPIHLSEITIPAPGNDMRGQAIQAVVARNLYRLWFSLKPMMGITWWNVVDDCGAPQEPSVSGLFSRNMDPKPAYHALNDLIHSEWKTKAELLADKDGRVSFRGFRGTYRLTWNEAGSEQSKLIEVK